MLFGSFSEGVAPQLTFIQLSMAAATYGTVMSSLQLGRASGAFRSIIPTVSRKPWLYISGSGAGSLYSTL